MISGDKPIALLKPVLLDKKRFILSGFCSGKSDCLTSHSRMNREGKIWSSFPLPSTYFFPSKFSFLSILIHHCFTNNATYEADFLNS